MYRFHTKSICIVTIWHQKIIIQNVLDPVHNVTFSHQFILFCIDTNVIILVPDRYNKKWFGAKSRYFLVRKRNVLFCRTWCQNVNIWCEFEIFSFVPIWKLNGNVFAPCSEFWCESVTNTSHFWCENVTNLVPDRYNTKWFGAKTRYFLVRKRDILFFMTWCENVKTWCEFETYAKGKVQFPKSQ